MRFAVLVESSCHFRRTRPPPSFCRTIRPSIWSTSVRSHTQSKPDMTHPSTSWYRLSLWQATLTLSRVRVDVEIGHRSQSHLRPNRCLARTPSSEHLHCYNRHLRQPLIWIVRSTRYPIVIGIDQPVQRQRRRGCARTPASSS